MTETTKRRRLAGGEGAPAAPQTPEQTFRRLIMANILWEDNAYQDGESVAEMIAEIIPQLKPEFVAQVAAEARLKQKLRSVPLFIAREMARHETHRDVLGDLLPQIIQRPDEISKFLEMYYADGRQPIAAQVKKGLAKAFERFDEYQLAKWNRKRAVTLKDAMRLVHPKPKDEKQSAMWKRLIDDELATPDTWEVALSRAGRTGEDKGAIWKRLIEEGRLGALAYLRNLNNMEEAGVPEDVIRAGFEKLNPRWLLPLNYLAAVKAQPKYLQEIETLMLRGLGTAPRLKGRTIFVIDASGSMNVKISYKSKFSRLDAATAMAIMATEMSDEIAVYVTAGGWTEHRTKRLPPLKGFTLANAIAGSRKDVGRGGIFTRQALEYIREREKRTPDRIMVFSDSQDCDSSGLPPKPFGVYNYVIDVSAHSHGVNYPESGWSAEISGMSEHFLHFVVEYERFDDELVF